MSAPPPALRIGDDAELRPGHRVRWAVARATLVGLGFVGLVGCDVSSNPRTFEPVLELRGQIANESCVLPVGDWDQDGHGDLLVGITNGYVQGRGPVVSGRLHSGRDGAVLLELRAPSENSYVTSVAALDDLDADGRMDFAVVGVFPRKERESGSTVQTFSSATGKLLGQWAAWESDQLLPGCASLRVPDQNADGFADLLVTTTDGRLRLLSGRDLAEIYAVPAGPGAGYVTPADDVDGDGAAECAYSGGGHTTVRRVVDGSLVFTTQGTRWDLGPDLDGDAVGDALVTLDGGQGQFVSGANGYPIRPAQGSRVGWTDDVDGDGRRDYLSLSPVVSLLGDSKRQFASVHSQRTHQVLAAIVLPDRQRSGQAWSCGDLDGDGRSEFAVLSDHGLIVYRLTLQP